MSNRLHSKKGVISCSVCGYPILTYDVNCLINTEKEDIIEASSFNYVKGSGPVKFDKMICSECGANMLFSIRTEWQRLKETREWDKEFNE